MKSLSLPLLLLMGACAAAAPRSAEQRQQDQATAICRQEVERTMRYRDRGQTMRTDEADSRLGAGSFTGTLTGSMSTDRLSSQFERDQMIDSCVRGATSASPAARSPGAAGAGAGRSP
ncbi:hypothetical protein EBE87_06400 [Pseudoroseomonas wenyumeiae]|uniref:Excinuclease ABC subunit B n=1 Tax=Teichococcus wenyumeiae TaxID=2478470 RepID=A0A3A9JGI5_9PROT|nr:hypothetical protein [Pseudoroseomonas wenyumeiae]RKK05682.1 hypothetical protein D6Z83_02820 [Pseudoroseomonas wenyumeiae]RMI26007.1 hypothetical protein EBE87_06400 [Pseudoroseomonas wenyumeiae]